MTELLLEQVRLRPCLDLDEVAIVIPTLNAAGNWQALSSAISQQGLAPQQVLIIDSSSTDGTGELVKAAGFRLKRIERKSFNHGGTRQGALAEMPWARIVVYLTQDAIPADAFSIQALCRAFEDPAVAVAYGRQLPRPEARAIERHARLFNYPATSQVRSLADAAGLGIKASFNSNSFAAYRRECLEEIGGFPPDVIVGEDVFITSRLLLGGWKVAYVAAARVFHSHNLTLFSEFSRYFDIGVHHARERWILNTFGRMGGEGKRFFLSELRYLWKSERRSIPFAFLRTVSKLIGYRLGRKEGHLPLSIVKLLSSQKAFWGRDTLQVQEGAQDAVRRRKDQSLREKDSLIASR